MPNYFFRQTFQTLLLLVAVLLCSERLAAQTIARCGEGWLELVDGYPVLHLKGTPYEMGYQHGKLFREHVRQNMSQMIEFLHSKKIVELGPITITPHSAIRGILKQQEKYVPEKYFEEMRGLADGAGLDAEDIRVCNFIPELMHCSGFAVMNSATADGTLYHGRVLDYAIDWGLQDHAVLIVAEPEGGIPFVNVTYAGFIGSVTGMNAKHVSIGEMGGGGYGNWEGVPMALLVREVIESAGDVDEAIAIFRDNPRTCQYFFVIADGKSNRAVGMEASWNRFELVLPGEGNELLPTPVTDSVLLSAGRRYRELVRRVDEGHGKFDANTALRLMDRPVAMSSNLHNVLFAPASTDFWVANASSDREPAAEQPYQKFNLQELLERQPDESVKICPEISS